MRREATVKEKTREMEELKEREALLVSTLNKVRNSIRLMKRGQPNKREWNV